MTGKIELPFCFDNYVQFYILFYMISQGKFKIILCLLLVVWLILVVDDDYDIASLIRISLEKVGLSASSFTDPSIALEVFKQKSSDYNLVISDIRMPTMNGYEFVQQLKKIKPNIRVLIMSAFEFNSNLPNNFSHSDVDDFLEKPITMTKLNKAVLSYTHN